MSERDDTARFETQFPRTLAAITKGIESGLHRGAQIYVSRARTVLANIGIGKATASEPMTAKTLNLWRSSGKPMTAAAILRLEELGSLSIDDSVQQHVPAFPHAVMTIRQLLAHTSGLPNRELPWPDAEWAEIITSVCDFPYDSGLGPAYSYQATWFLLGEILRRRNPDPTMPFGELIRTNLFEPLGMTSTWNGMSAADWQANQHRVARQQTITLSGRTRDESLHEEQYFRAASPGANLRSTARDVGRFYEAISNGQYFANTETLERMTTPQREPGAMDATFRAKVRTGLGVILAAPDATVPYGFGDSCSPKTFGHGGAQCAMAFCDPERELVVAWAVNGFPGEPKHQKRNADINSSIARDLESVDISPAT